MSDAKRRANYTLKFKTDAVQMVRRGQAMSVAAKVLGIPRASLGNWVKLSARGQLDRGGRQVSVEQMELTRLRVQLAQVMQERDMLKEATEYFVRETL